MNSITKERVRHLTLADLGVAQNAPEQEKMAASYAEMRASDLSESAAIRCAADQCGVEPEDIVYAVAVVNGEQITY